MRGIRFYFHNLIVVRTLSCYCRSRRLPSVIGRLPEVTGPEPGNTLGQPDAFYGGGRDLSHASGDSFLLHINGGEDRGTLPDVVANSGAHL